jgi:hypothetical protein
MSVHSARILWVTAFVWYLYAGSGDRPWEKTATRYASRSECMEARALLGRAASATCVSSDLNAQRALNAAREPLISRDTRELIDLWQGWVWLDGTGRWSRRVRTFPARDLCEAYANRVQAAGHRAACFPLTEDPAAAERAAGAR